MVLPSTTSKRSLVTEADILAAGPDNDNNDIEDAHVANIYTVIHSSISTRSYITQPQEWGQIREVS